MLCRVPRWVALALVLCGGLALALAPASAQDPGTATVSVEASIVTPTELSITLCDTTADFGDGLNYLGTLPTTGTTDTIFATSPGDRTQNQGVFYGWTPTCDAGTSLMHVESNIPWRGTVCSTESNGSSSLKIGTNDLRFSIAEATTYEQAVPFAHIKTCTEPTTLVNGEQAGTFDLNYHLYLQVDRNDTPGTFNTSTTWAVTP